MMNNEFDISDMDPSEITHKLNVSNRTCDMLVTMMKDIEQLEVAMIELRAICDAAAENVMMIHLYNSGISQFEKLCALSEKALNAFSEIGPPRRSVHALGDEFEQNSMKIQTLATIIHAQVSTAIKDIEELKRQYEIMRTTFN